MRCKIVRGAMLTFDRCMCGAPLACIVQMHGTGRCGGCGRVLEEPGDTPPGFPAGPPAPPEGSPAPPEGGPPVPGGSPPVAEEDPGESTEPGREVEEPGREVEGLPGGGAGDPQHHIAIEEVEG